MNGADRAAGRLAALGHALNRHARVARQDSAPTPAQDAVLSRLIESGPSTARELADIERVRPQSMAALLGTMERAGWVVRRNDPGDRRRVTISLTTAGRSASARLGSARAAHLARALAADPTIDPHALEEAVRLVREVVERLGEATPAPPGLPEEPDTSAPTTTGFTVVFVVLALGTALATGFAARLSPAPPPRPTATSLDERSHRTP